MPSDLETLKTAVFGDLERELEVTRKVLAALPEGQKGWKPHDKSMSLERLALHVATLPGWCRVTLAADQLDFASAPRPPESFKDVAELLALFDKQVVELREAVANFDMTQWHNPWTLRNGTQVIVTKPRPFVYRVWNLNHLVHHRGQLALYLRLLNVPVPTIYFNTADNPEFNFE